VLWRRTPAGRATILSPLSARAETLKHFPRACRWSLRVNEKDGKRMDNMVRQHWEVLTENKSNMA